MLAFGLNDALPAGCEAAWGCRAICTQDGSVEVLYDRQSAAGKDRDLLLRHLNLQEPRMPWRAAASKLLREGTMKTREAHRVLLHEDEQVQVWGDTKASAGYLYVAAFFHPETCRFCGTRHGDVDTYCQEAAAEHRRAGLKLLHLVGMGEAD